MSDWRGTLRVTAGLLTTLAMVWLGAEARGQNGNFTNASGGSWALPTNWQGLTVADGVDNTADFGTLNLTANATVTLDSNRTIGHLVFGDTTPSHNWTVNPGTPANSTLTLDVTTGSPTVTVNNQTTTIGAVVAGSDGLTKAGGGTLVLSAANTYSGTTTVSAGTLVVNGSLGANSAVVVANGGRLAGVGAVDGSGVNAAVVQQGGTIRGGVSDGTNNLGSLTILGGVHVRGGNPGSQGALEVEFDSTLPSGSNASTLTLNGFNNFLNFDNTGGLFAIRLVAPNLAPGPYSDVVIAVTDDAANFQINTSQISSTLSQGIEFDLSTTNPLFTVSNGTLSVANGTQLVLSFDVTAVPEPGGIMLACAAACALAGARRLRLAGRPAAG